MATTNTIFLLNPAGYTPTGTIYATPDWIEDGSTPTTLIPVLDYDATTSEHADWHVDVPSHYDGGGFTISWKGGTDNTSVGVLSLEIRIIKVADAAILTDDLGVDAAVAVTINDTPPATPINKLNYSTTGTLSHINAGSLSPGDAAIIRATRNTGVGSNNTGDLQLAKILILET